MGSIGDIGRDKLVAEGFRRKVGEQLSQVATKGIGHRKSGVRDAARTLGIDKDEAHRAVKVASLTREAQEAAS